LEPGPSSVQCTSRFDCASSEHCIEGLCTFVGREITREPPDAGTVAMMPQQAPKDGGGMDPVQPDSGLSSGGRDAETPIQTPPDSGCNTGITVVELPNQSFCSIGKAIIAAPSSGTVDIPAATYNESLTVDKTLTLRGAGAAGVTVRALPSRAVVTVNAIDVVILSMTLEANSSEGVNITGGALLQDVTVKNSVGAGIRVSGTGSTLNSRNLLVSRVTCAGGCTAQDWGEGVVLGPATSALLIDTTIEDTDFIGLYVQNAQVRMENGWIKRSGRTYCMQNEAMCLPGVYMFSASTAVFQANTWIQECGGSGIETKDSTLEVRASRVENNGIRLVPYVDGVHVDGSSATLFDSDVNGNLGYGIGCVNSVSISSCSTNRHERNQQGWTNGACSGC
jgi:nitrous oxidase accessory protein NosD